MSDDDFSPYDLNHVAQARRKLERGEPCRHPGCLSHVSHPCEGCGRVGGTITLEEALTIEAENKMLAELLSALENRVDDLSRALSAKEEIVAIYARCVRDAGCLWRKAHPGSEMYPDGVDLIVWLKEQVDTLAARRCETCRHRIGISALGTNICAVFGTMSCYIRGCDYWEARPMRNCGNCLYWHAVPIGVGQGRCALLPEQADAMYCTDTCNKHELKETPNA